MEQIVVSALDGPTLRCAIETSVSNTEAGAASDKKFDSVSVTVYRRPVQGSAAEDALRIDFGAVVQQILDDLSVPVASSSAHRV